MVVVWIRGNGWMVGWVGSVMLEGKRCVEWLYVLTMYRTLLRISYAAMTGLLAGNAVYGEADGIPVLSTLSLFRNRTVHLCCSHESPLLMRSSGMVERILILGMRRRWTARTTLFCDGVEWTCRSMLGWVRSVFNTVSSFSLSS